MDLYSTQSSEYFRLVLVDLVQDLLRCRATYPLLPKSKVHDCTRLVGAFTRLKDGGACDQSGTSILFRLRHNIPVGRPSVAVVGSWVILITLESVLCMIVQDNVF